MGWRFWHPTKRTVVEVLKPSAFYGGKVPHFLFCWAGSPKYKWEDEEGLRLATEVVTSLDKTAFAALLDWMRENEDRCVVVHECLPEILDEAVAELNRERIEWEEYLAGRKQ